MLKQPKYRAKSKETNEWVYGYGWYSTNYDVEKLAKYGLSEQDDVLTTEEGYIRCHSNTVGVCFGLQIADTQEDVYTGDIVQNSTNNVKYEVIWGELDHCLLFHEVGTDYGSLDFTSLDTEYDFSNIIKA